MLTLVFNSALAGEKSDAFHFREKRKKSETRVGATFYLPFECVNFAQARHLLEH